MRDSWCRQPSHTLTSKDIQKSLLTQSPLLKKLSMNTETRPNPIRSSSAVFNRRPKIQDEILKLTISNKICSKHKTSTIQYNSSDGSARMCTIESENRMSKVGARGSGALNKGSRLRLKRGLTSFSKPQLILNFEERKNPFKEICKEQVEKMERGGMYGLVNSGVLPRGVNISRFLNQVPVVRLRNQSQQIERSNTFITGN